MTDNHDYCWVKHNFTECNVEVVLVFGAAHPTMIFYTIDRNEQSFLFNISRYFESENQLKFLVFWSNVQKLLGCKGYVFQNLGII